jgi:dTDP-4-amino-4,6-dideoxygalactose transaminase
MKVPFVDLKAQYKTIKKDIDKAIRTIIDRAEFIGGPPVREFESSFAKIQEIKACAGCSSGTSALFLALKALGVGSGDEVITVPNTFIATSESITESGAEVKFCDIDPVSYTMDPLKFQKAITKKTKAVIVVHLHGRMAEMDLIRKIADKHKLLVIEDAAQAHLARFKDKPVGFYSHAACFSFYPGKNLGAYGDAGAVCSNDENITTKVRMLANHGRIKKYEHMIEGYNHRLDAFQASILSAKLPYLKEWTERRRTIAKKYSHNLKDVVKVPQENPDHYNVYHLYVIRTTAADRDKLREHLGRAGIQTGIHYPLPLHLQPAYKHLKLKKGSFPEAEQSSLEILSLPIFPEMSDIQVSYVIENVRKYFKK